MFQNDLLKKINEKMLTLSKGQKKLALFILEHYDEAAFMTASKLVRRLELVNQQL